LGETAQAKRAARPGLARVRDEDLGRLLAGKYRLDEVIGEGGFGHVYRATHIGLGRRFAVKLAKASLASDEQALRRFLGEAEKTARIDHEHVVGVVDSGTDDRSRPFFVMELLKGKTLAELLDREKRLPATRAIAITLQLLDALAAAHSQTADHPVIIHRDLKPSNVMLERVGALDDFVKIVDFGIAKALGDATEGITQEGQVPGTRGYVAPEAFLGGETHPRMDVFSSGVILYEMLTGIRPWKGQSFEQMVHAAKLKQQPPALRDACPQLPERLEDIVATAMSLDPANRYQSADEFGADLLQLDDLGMDELLPGTAIDDAYVVEENLGSGRYGVVYQVRRRPDDRHLAVKLLLDSNDPDDDRELRRRFLQEADILAAIDHPNVVHLEGSGAWRGHLYLAMELVEGRSLRDAWSAMGWLQLLDVFKEVAAGLMAVHAKGIVHRDLSPENILLDASGHAKLVDFGTAHASRSHLTRSTLTMRLGRLGYMAPEQAEDAASVTPATDQWALAAIIYEALTNHPPHVQGDLENTEEEVALAGELQEGGPPPAPSKAHPSVTAAMDGVVLRALSHEPQDRYATVVAFVDELARISSMPLALPERGALPHAAHDDRPRGSLELARHRPATPPTHATLPAPSNREAVARITAAEKTNARRPLRRRLLVVAAAVAVAGLGGWALARRQRNLPPVEPSSTQTQSPTGRAASASSAPPVVRPLSKIDLDSVPTGGEAFIEGRLYALPVVLERPVGTRVSVSIQKAGYAPETVELAFVDARSAKKVDLHRRDASYRSNLAPTLRPTTRSAKRRVADEPRRRSLLVSPTPTTK
jgi:serine/threonine protein kinase